MITSILELPHEELKKMILAYLERRAEEWTLLKRKYHKATETKEDLEISTYVFSLIPNIIDLYLKFLLNQISNSDLIKDLKPPMEKLLVENDASLIGDNLRKAFLSKSLYVFTVFGFDRNREEMLNFFNRALRFVRSTQSPAYAFKEAKIYDYFLRAEVSKEEYRKRLEIMLNTLSPKWNAGIIKKGEESLKDSPKTAVTVISREEFSKRMAAWNGAISDRILEAYHPRPT